MLLVLHMCILSLEYSGVKYTFVCEHLCVRVWILSSWYTSVLSPLFLYIVIFKTIFVGKLLDFYFSHFFFCLNDLNNIVVYAWTEQIEQFVCWFLRFEKVEGGENAQRYETFVICCDVETQFIRRHYTIFYLLLCF